MKHYPTTTSPMLWRTCAPLLRTFQLAGLTWLAVAGSEVSANALITACKALRHLAG